MRLLFNTIMIEPNRWTADHVLSRPLADLLPAVRATGFEELEIWQYHVSAMSQVEIEELATSLAASGLAAGALGAYPQFHLDGQEWEQMRSRLEQLVGYGRVLGIEAFKVFPGRVASADADATLWQLTVERLRWLAGLLAEAGALLTMETHGNTLCDTLDSTRRLLDDLADCGNVGICFQPYADADTDAAMAAYDALSGRVRHIHLQNRMLAGRATSLLRDGDWTDYGRFLPHVRRRGFDGLFCLEFTAGITPAEGEPFDAGLVLDNATRDREFALAAWEGRPGA